jgi:hypothetical protein
LPEANGSRKNLFESGKLFETKRWVKWEKTNCLMEMGRIINSRGNTDVMMTAMGWAWDPGWMM